MRVAGRAVESWAWRLSQSYAEKSQRFNSSAKNSCGMKISLIESISTDSFNFDPKLNLSELSKPVSVPFYVC